MVVFFMDADENVYARYGQRTATDADALQSLAGLRHTMTSVLGMHQDAARAFAPKEAGPPRTVRDLPRSGRLRGCMHCHDVKEAMMSQLQRAGKWERDMAFRYPLPETVGLTLEVDRGNVIGRVAAGSAAARAGLAKGDVLRRLNGVPVHSIADAQFGLDRAPSAGRVDVIWQRDGKELTAAVELTAGWRKTDISWRPSARRLTVRLPLYGADLSEAEKQALGLPAKALAVRLRREINPTLQAAGLRPGDVVVGVDGRRPRQTVSELREWAAGEYLRGDKITIDVLREGKTVKIPYAFR